MQELSNVTIFWIYTTLFFYSPWGVHKFIASISEHPPLLDMKPHKTPYHTDSYFTWTQKPSHTNCQTQSYKCSREWIEELNYETQSYKFSNLTIKIIHTMNRGDEVNFKTRPYKWSRSGIEDIVGGKYWNCVRIEIYISTLPMDRWFSTVAYEENMFSLQRIETVYPCNKNVNAKSTRVKRWNR